MFFAQQATIKGIIKNEQKHPIEGVAVTCNNLGVTANSNGEYLLTIPANKKITVSFSHISFTTLLKDFEVPANKTLRFSPILQLKTEKIKEVIVKDLKKETQGFIQVNANEVQKIPGANEGVENVLMTLPGVQNNNELSSQYNVRGGNFDENLVYVNGIEVYRPFLVRSGQQEGLSFVNGAMVQNVNFSAGGFQAKYGDKLSSVLDITYRNPQEFELAVSSSLLGGSITGEGTMLNKKLSILAGVRYRNNNLFINSKDIKTNSNPNFTDVQSFISYQLNPSFKIEFLGNFSLNNYNYKPKTRSTNFGTVSNPLNLIVNYEGEEKDKFNSLFGALKGSYRFNENIQISLTNSVFHTIEEEHFDILATYNLGEVTTDAGSDNFGNSELSEKIGSQLNHARNDLDAIISNTALKVAYQKNEHEFDVGFKLQHENIRDRINEWEVIDSLGFSVRPPNVAQNNEPYIPYQAALEPFQSINAENDVNINRQVFFSQYSKNTFWDYQRIYYNVGVRAHHWKVSGQNLASDNHTTLSFRGQFAIKPNWRRDMWFRLSVGTYNQPPFYKELRNESGNVVTSVKDQKSWQFVLANDYTFNLWERPFKLTSEIYYKNLTDINIYTVDNVKVRYVANNNATAFATGLDVRLNGEFVPGTESWISIGFLKTSENYNNQGYIARPTDQRFKFAMLFQDYVPNIPNIKMHLNLIFQTGLPGGAPSYANPYLFQNRLNAYKRADIGISYVLKDKEDTVSNTSFSLFKELVVGFEIVNMFDVKNAITNTWVRDSYSKKLYGIPNYMTPRVFNIKIGMKF